MISNLQLSNNVKERRSQLSKAGVAMTLYNLVIWVDCWLNAAQKLYQTSHLLPLLQDGGFHAAYPTAWGITACLAAVYIALAIGWVYVRFCLAGFKKNAPQKYFAIIVLQLVLVGTMVFVYQGELIRLGWMSSYEMTGLVYSAVWDVLLITVMGIYFKKRAALFDL
jgi:hypothetical protein